MYGAADTIMSNPENPENLVVVLDHHRPHYTITVTPPDGEVDENGEAIPVCVHVLPAYFIDDIIDGKMSITDMDDWEAIMRVILGDWRDFVMEEAQDGGDK